MSYVDLVARRGAAAPSAAHDPLPGAPRWSDPAAWDGGVPADGQAVKIPAGRSVVLDRDLRVASLEIEGTLVVGARDTRIEAHWILVRGAGVLRAGRPEQAFAHTLDIVLSGGPAAARLPWVGERGLVAAHGGTLELIGARRVAWVELQQTVHPGMHHLTLAAPVDWQVGESIVLASGGPDLARVEEHRIVAVASDSRMVTLAAGLAHHHPGALGPYVNAPGVTVARVALLDRAIRIGADDAGAAQGHGAHVLITGRDPHDEHAAPRRAIGRLQGVALSQVGEFNRAGRFPLHWCEDGDAVESSVTACVVRDSWQRGLVLDRTRHVRLADNVVLRPHGHGYVVEPGADLAALAASNLAIRPRAARFTDPALRGLCETRPRAFWATGSIG